MPDLPGTARLLSLRSMSVAVLLAIVTTSLFSPWGQAQDQDHEQERETSRLLAILFDSGRLVVGMNQNLIDDASKGD
jgi:hypothetical protein